MPNPDMILLYVEGARNKVTMQCNDHERMHDSPCQDVFERTRIPVFVPTWMTTNVPVVNAIHKIVGFRYR